MSILGPAAKVIVWRERPSVVSTGVWLPSETPTTRTKPGSETTAQKVLPRDIKGPGENVMVSMSRISVVARGGRPVAPVDDEHATLQ